MAASASVQPESASIGELKLSRALLSGLPTLEGVRDKLSSISAPVLVAAPQLENYSQSFAQGAPLLYSELEHRAFQADFRDDLNGLQQRMIRLKLHLANDLSRGKRFVVNNENDPLCKNLRDLAYVSPGRQDQIGKDQQSALIEAYNHLVPEELRIPKDQPLGRIERNLIYNLTFSMQFSEPLRAELQVEMHTLCGHLSASMDRISKIKQSPLLFSEDLGEPHEFTLEQGWSMYRSFVKQLAALCERESWFSPALIASLELQKGFNQGSIERGRTDYQRWKINDLEKLERNLQFTYYGERDYYENVECFLTPSGMAGFQSILNFINYNHNRYSKISNVKIRPLNVCTVGAPYFELQEAIDKFCTTEKLNHTHLRELDTDTLIARIKEEAPDIVVIEPLANSHELRMVDLKSVVTALCDRDWIEQSRTRFFDSHGLIKREINLVIDNTMLGIAADWKSLKFDELPRFVRIFVVDSLTKFGQDGLDMASVGLVTTVGEYLGGEYKKFHQRSSLAINEATFHKLSIIHSDERSTQKHARHHRNTVLLSKMLDSVASPDGFITGVNHPSLPSHPDHKLFKTGDTAAGSIVTIDFATSNPSLYARDSLGDVERKMRSKVAAFEKLVVELAREQNLPINVGSSFGFNRTRIATYCYLGMERVHDQPLLPYLRVAVGAESYKDIKMFAAILGRANEIFSSALKENRISSLSDTIFSSDFKIQRLPL